MIEEYLNRIGFNSNPEVNIKSLKALHKAHLFSVPFENLDIQNSVKLNLDTDYLFQKVVKNKRGGFCYELNSLFGWLLTEIGYDSRMVAARTFDKESVLQPEYDHMALIVELDEPWLADVGFGDLMIEPIKLNHSKIQHDVFNSFKIEILRNGDYQLNMAFPGTSEFQKQYTFNSVGEVIDNFKPECIMKETDPNSHFRINKICTIATPQGRKTIRNDTFVEKRNGIRRETIINGEIHENILLKEHFNIELLPLIK